MTIYRQLAEVPADFGPSALTIGNFDGVHFGHRRILRRVRAVAAERGLKASVLTFHPHPTSVVAPERVPSLMTSPERRCDLMREEGIEQVLILPFTAQLSRLSPEEFVRQLLVERLAARVVLVGANFRFGYRQAGNVEVLRELGARYGFGTETIPAVKCRGRVVSSSVLRDLVRAGGVGLAARLLERPYALEGEVVAGRGVGSKQTVPTLNLATESEVIPAAGVYVTATSDVQDGRAWQSLTNVGYRPTFGAGGPLSIETFLLQPLAGDTPRRIRVEFLWRVRGERRFETPEALKAQILADARRAQAWFRRTRRWVRPLPGLPGRTLPGRIFATDPPL
jgi:riboflavin kinase / FMN adenylyltransferase